MNDGDEGGYEPSLPILELRGAGLRVENGEFVHVNSTGGAIFRIPLDDIESVDYERTFNLAAVYMLLFAIGIAVLGYQFSEYQLLSVTFYFIAFTLGLISFIMLRVYRIVIRSRGERFGIIAPEVTDEIIGFVLSIKPMCGGRARET
jgi:hypothetical protein